MSKNRNQLSAEQIQSFLDHGYLIVPELFDREETDLLLAAAQTDSIIQEHTMDIDDKSGKSNQIAVWNHPGDDIWGMVSRSHRIVDAMEAMLGGEVYHYHSKLLYKKPEVGGAWEWHQDYGYWYKNGCLFPYLASCWIALDRADKSNGCMQVIKGSHHAGRIEHGVYSGQHCFSIAIPCIDQMRTPAIAPAGISSVATMRPATIHIRNFRIRNIHCSIRFPTVLSRKWD